MDEFATLVEEGTGGIELHIVSKKEMPSSSSDRPTETVSHIFQSSCKRSF